MVSHVVNCEFPGTEIFHCDLPRRGAGRVKLYLPALVVLKVLYFFHFLPDFFATLIFFLP